MTPAHGLTPQAVETRARPATRLPVAFAPRFVFLLGAGLLWLVPTAASPRFVLAMAAWDAAVIAVWLVDAWRLPPADRLTVQRTWLAPPSLSVAGDVRITLTNGSATTLWATLVDAVPRELRSEPPAQDVVVGPRAAVDTEYRIRPRARGAIAVGDVHLRYESRWRIAQRWARAPLAQTIVAYPNLEEARRESVNARTSPADAERRARRTRGFGRAFASLREHREGDEFRDICWTASARRGKLVTRLYESEKSQPIWIVIDAGRLMRARVGGVTKLDLAVNAALTLSRVALAAGDRIGLLVYGRRIGQRLPISRGGSHLRQVVERLAVVRPEQAEADHLLAAGRLLTDQKRRSLIVWITDVPDAAMTPEVVTAASTLMSRHLVLFVVIGQPDLQLVASRTPATIGDMYETAAAQEVTHRRDVLLARLRARGALVLETWSRLSPALVNLYLDVKRENRL